VLANATTGTDLRSVKEVGEGGLATVAFSSDGKLVAAGVLLHGNTVTVSNVATGATVKTLAVASPYDVAFSPDGTRFAALSSGGLIMMWDARTWKPLRPIASDGFLNAVAFSPDGSIVVGAGTEVNVWDVRSGRSLGTRLPVADNNGAQIMKAIAISATGAVASVDDAGVINTWQSLPFGSNDSTVQQQFCGITRGNLSRADWAQYAPSESYHQTCPQYPPGS
jgi:WD40 repeat protein